MAAAHVEITSYAEVVLAPLNADLAHRAFSNLFVTTEVLGRPAGDPLHAPEADGPTKPAPWMFHLLVQPGQPDAETSYETDRARFIGRGRRLDRPAAMDASVPRASRRLAARSLDPIVAIRRVATIAPDESATVHDRLRAPRARARRRWR